MYVPTHHDISYIALTSVLIYITKYNETHNLIDSTAWDKRQLEEHLRLISVNYCWLFRVVRYIYPYVKQITPILLWRIATVHMYCIAIEKSINLYHTRTSSLPLPMIDFNTSQLAHQCDFIVAVPSSDFIYNIMTSLSNSQKHVHFRQGKSLYILLFNLHKFASKAILQNLTRHFITRLWYRDFYVIWSIVLGFRYQMDIQSMWIIISRSIQSNMHIHGIQNGCNQCRHLTQIRKATLQDISSQFDITLHQNGGNDQNIKNVIVW